MVQTANIQNNSSTTALIKQLKDNPKQYPLLNKKQERELIEKYKDDRETLNKLLFMHNIRLVFNMAKKYAMKTPDFDALVSDCFYGLAIACKRFDITRDIKFSTFAHTWIFKYCLSGFYSHQAEIDRHSISINSKTCSYTAKSSEDGNATFENFVNEYVDESVPLCANIQQTTEKQVSSLEKIDICKKLYSRLDLDDSLSATDKAMFTDVVYYKMRPKDVAQKYGTKSSDVIRVRNEVLTKFKNILQNEYHIESMEDLDA